MITLTSSQIEDYLRNGVLVVENVLTKDELQASLEGLSQTLTRKGVESLDKNDEASARAFAKLSSTNGSGGVLDMFYEDWKLDIATNPNLFAITQQLWKAGYCCDGEAKESLTTDDRHRWHPHGIFDCNEGFLYMDRIGYRLPTQLAQEWGNLVHPNKKKKQRAVQRSLTPHLDCCPETLFAANSPSKKWRPIQCFVSLTETQEANTGGFEAARGFHREMEAWAENRPPTVFHQKGSNGTTEVAIPAPCVGEYTHIRPKEDAGIMARIHHVAIPAGGAVFFDNRIPHANAYRHTGDIPRAVVYCSFLPNVALNREYVKKQLDDYQQGTPPRDQWNNMEEDRSEEEPSGTQRSYSFSSLGSKLMGIDQW